MKENEEVDNDEKDGEKRKKEEIVNDEKIDEVDEVENKHENDENNSTVRNGLDGQVIVQEMGTSKLETQSSGKSPINPKKCPENGLLEKKWAK